MPHARPCQTHARPVPATHRRSRVPTSKQLPLEIENALNKLRATPNAATDCLRRYQLIPEDSELSSDTLSTGLLHFAASPNAKLGAWAIETICAFAIYVQDIRTEKLTDAIWHKLKPELATQAIQHIDSERIQEEQSRKQEGLLEGQEREMSGVAGRITKEVKTITEGHAQLAKELDEVRSLQRNLITTLERLATTTAKAEETLRNPPAPALHTHSGPDPASRPTYAAMLMHVLLASHATSLIRQDAQFRQVLIDIKGGDNEEAASVLTEAEYVKKAMVTLDLMCDDNFPPPDNLHFLTVKHLRNGGLLYEINMREGAA